MFNIEEGYQAGQPSSLQAKKYFELKTYNL
jgi:hypothetical protein